jgi:hypothetical protein
MKTFNAKFAGREAGAIGIFADHKITITAVDAEAARIKLYDTHDHIMHLKLEEIPTIPTRSPFDADNLVLYVQNDSKAHATIRACVQRLQDAIDNAADHLAKANKEWHDDPEADDHEAYHADSFEQFPRAERTKALRELLERHTDTINEGAGFWPDDFAKIKAGDFVRLTDGTPAVVTSEPSGGRIYVAYKTDIHGPAITKAAEWNEIESHSPAN